MIALRFIAAASARAEKTVREKDFKCPIGIFVERLCTALAMLCLLTYLKILRQLQTIDYLFINTTTNTLTIFSLISRLLIVLCLNIWFEFSLSLKFIFC